MLYFEPTSQSCWPGCRVIVFMLVFFLYTVAIKADNQSNLGLIKRKEHFCFWVGLHETSIHTETTLTNDLFQNKVFPLFFISKVFPVLLQSWAKKARWLKLWGGVWTWFHITQIPTPSDISQSALQRLCLQKNNNNNHTLNVKPETFQQKNALICFYFSGQGLREISSDTVVVCLKHLSTRSVRSIKRLKMCSRNMFTYYIHCTLHTFKA